MDFEQILIRLGIDAKAATVGMTQFKSWAKGWATDLGATIKHHLMGTVGAGAALFGLERVFDAIKEKAMFVNRTAKETGLSTNMVQGMANELGYVGESFEEISKPLGKFNVLIGQAKRGIPEARQKLIEWGLAAKGENWNNFTLQRGLLSLSKEFERLGSHEARAALLQQAFGKSFQSMMPIFEQGSSAMEKLGKGNFFTKLTPTAVEAYSSSWKGALMYFGGFGTAIANIAGSIVGLPGRIGTAFGELSAMKKFPGKTMDERIHGFNKLALYTLTGIGTEERKNNETLKEKGDLLKENLKTQQQQNEAAKLQAELGDRSKGTVGELADRARSITGNKRRGLGAVYAMTPSMMTSMRIQDLEDEAHVASAAYGNQPLADNLRSQANKIRSNSPFLTAAERNPMESTENKLNLILESLDLKGIRVKGIKDVP